MKKYILTLMSVVLLSGCQFFNQTEETAETPVEESSSVQVETEVEHVTVTVEEKDEEADSDAALFNESVMGDSEFPTATVPESVTQSELLSAIEEYYIANFSVEQQAANAPQVTDAALANVLDLINGNEALAQLNVTVDQISMVLNGQTIYVPRVIVPMTYSESTAIAEENDVALFNSAITEVGNRLIMIAYYDEASDQLMPMHLMNLNHSLFYNEPN